MIFDFANPYILLLLPVIFALTLFAYRKMSGLASWRRRLVLGLRLTVFTLLILCLSGLGIKTKTNEITTIFVVDQSDSIAREMPALNKAVAEALKEKKPDEKVGIVAFGSNALIEILPNEKVDFTSIQSKVEGGFTNVEQALRLASSLIPAKDNKRIVLFSDGRENSGDVLKQAAILKSQGIALDVFPVFPDDTGEVQLKDISIPETLRINEDFEVVVKVNSTVKTGGTLRLFANRQLAAERKVDIQKGENNFVFIDKASKEGIVTYTAVIDPDIDQSYRNNSLSAFSDIGGKPRVLIVQDENKGASELEKILKGNLITNVVMADNAPISIAELQNYDAFIISDVPAEKLDDRFLNSLENCIRHQGKGLLVTGGENSYAPGGYYKTVLEKVLPVNMDIKPEKEDPNLGLVLVIDKSGSMSMGQYGVSKIELAKEAAIRSTEVLQSDDMIGVIGFDDAVNWVVKTQKLINPKKIQDAIGTMRAGGGTQILPPLEEAYESLKDADTKLKHIILLTDGQAERSGYEAIIEKINAAGITLSTVAVGMEADSQLLQALANGGNGRFYMTDEFSDIPKIFARETFLAGKTYLNNRTFTPNLMSYSDVLKGIDAIPELDGYVAATAKGTAKVVFSSDRDEPILATWQYGLGRTAAWTPDAKGMWTSKWLKWDQSPLFWKNLVSWLLQKNTVSDYSIKTGFESGKGRLELTLPPEGRLAGEKVSALLVSPTGMEQQIDLTPEAPGVYSGSFEGEEEGVYIANISITGSTADTGSISENTSDGASGGATGHEPGSTSNSGVGDERGGVREDGSAAGFETSDVAEMMRIVAGITVPYSPEYDIPEEGISDFIKRIAREAGGRILDDPRDALKGDLPSIASVTDVSQPLIIVVILLFFLDIAFRRINIPADRIRLIMQKTAGSVPAAVGRALGLTRTSRLKHSQGLSSERAWESESDRVVRRRTKGLQSSETPQEGIPGGDNKRNRKDGYDNKPMPGEHADSTASSTERERRNAHIDRLLEKKRKRDNMH